MYPKDILNLKNLFFSLGTWKHRTVFAAKFNYAIKYFKRRYLVFLRLLCVIFVLISYLLSASSREPICITFCTFLREIFNFNIFSIKYTYYTHKRDGLALSELAQRMISVISELGIKRQMCLLSRHGNKDIPEKSHCMFKGTNL